MEKSYTYVIGRQTETTVETNDTEVDFDTLILLCMLFTPPKLSPVYLELPFRSVV